MRKAVLISIQPKWCELISRKEKTLEVRKSKPKIKVPFKCYIYCTKKFVGGKGYGYKEWAGAGKVIGEFICDAIFVDGTYGHNKTFYDMACMSETDIVWYCCQLPMYGWHISDLKIYDKPKELTEFKGLRTTKFGYEPVEIKRPPQSWCYVEEREENA